MSCWQCRNLKGEETSSVESHILVNCKMMIKCSSWSLKTRSYEALRSHLEPFAPQEQIKYI